MFLTRRARRGKDGAEENARRAAAKRRVAPPSALSTLKGHVAADNSRAAARVCMCVVAILGAAVATTSLHAQRAAAERAEQAVYPTVKPTGPLKIPMIQPPVDDIEILPIRGHVYALLGDGGNITVSIGGDGVLVVDTGKVEMTDKLLAAIRRLQVDYALHHEPALPDAGAEGRSSIVDRHVAAPPKPIRYILNTSADADHTGGNEKVRDAGVTYTGGNVAGDIRDAGEGAAIFAHENVLKTLSTPVEGQAPVPSGDYPTDTYYVDYYKLSQFVNGEGVELIHVPKAHSDGDSVIWLRGSDVMALGDLMDSERFPVIDVAHGGTINGVIDGLNHVLDLSITEFRTEGGTMIVPGHGRLTDSADVSYYRDMLTIIRDRVQAFIKKGATLEQVKAARLAGGWDAQWGAGSGPASTDKFIEAVYTTLGGGTKPTPAPNRRNGRTE